MTESPSSESRVPALTPGAPLGPRTATAITVPVAVVAPQRRVDVADRSPDILGDLGEHRVERRLVRDEGGQVPQRGLLIGEPVRSRA
jgi:hypothetical protein